MLRSRFLALLTIVAGVLAAPMPMPTDCVSATIDDDTMTMSVSPLAVNPPSVPTASDSVNTMGDPFSSMQIIYTSGIPALPDENGSAASSDASLEYSVFFPADFDFVSGGKIPRMYGGRQKCAVEDTGPEYVDHTFGSQDTNRSTSFALVRG